MQRPSIFAFIEGETETSWDVKISPVQQLEPAEALLSKALTGVQSTFIKGHRTAISNTLFSIPYPGVEVGNNRIFEATDIIHLHWTTWGITPTQISEWLNSQRMIVWTLHDMWPMTGGCHYSAGCLQFRTACLNCPQLSDKWSLVPNAFSEKMAAYGDGRLWIVTPSRWLANEARESAILKRARVVTIPNAINTEVFSPAENRAALRAAFGIGPNDIAILFGSVKHREWRKGGQILKRALELLAENHQLASDTKNRIVFVTFGEQETTEHVHGAVSLDLGTITDDEVLADAYRISDITCVPSLEENYPNVVLESLSCGTPCIAFDTGGIGELIRNERTGILVSKVGDANALAEGLLRYVNNHHGDQQMRAACRDAVVRTNSYAAVGAQLDQLYSEMLKDSDRPRNAIESPYLARVARAFSTSASRPDVSVSDNFVQFPANYLLRRLGGDGMARVGVRRIEQKPKRPFRIIAARAHHSHHSAHSGPYQFLRTLPENFEVSHYMVPLGHELTNATAAKVRSAGLALGTRAFAQQGNAWLAEAELLTRCSQEHFDIIHYIDGELGGWLLPAVPSALFNRGRRPKFVATFHQPPETLESFINPRLVSKIDAAVVLCEDSRRHLSSLIDERRVHLIPHGIDLDFFKPRPTDRPRPTGHAELLAVGHWLRDYPTALAAFQRVRQQMPSAQFTIVTPVPLQGDLPDGVRIVTGLSDEELRAMYWASDVLFMPLRDATANNAILEAMACGLPVVTTAVGGVREATGDAAILCRLDDAADIADRTLWLLSDETRRRHLAETAIERVKKFDWRHVSEFHARLYGSLLADGLEESRHAHIGVGADVRV